jgi:hypothetical protein
MAGIRTDKNEIHPVLIYGLSAFAGAVATGITLWNDGVLLALMCIPMGAGFMALVVDLLIYSFRGRK